jgi:hypothetical protein
MILLLVNTGLGHGEWKVGHWPWVHGMGGIGHRALVWGAGYKAPALQFCLHGQSWLEVFLLNFLCQILECCQIMWYDVRILI